LIVTGGAPTNGILLSQCLVYIERFRKSRAIAVENLIANIEPGILDCTPEAVNRSRSAECEHMPAGLEHAPHLTPELDRKGAVACVPFLTHEAASPAAALVFESATAFWANNGLALPAPENAVTIDAPLHVRSSVCERIRRICNAGVDAVLWQPLNHVEAIAAMHDNLAVEV
jgi:hypothetical protein